jgi:hypothetical protein
MSTDGEIKRNKAMSALAEEVADFIYDAEGEYIHQAMDSIYQLIWLLDQDYEHWRDRQVREDTGA